MYLILTASKDTYITNKIVSTGASASAQAFTSITIAGGALDVNAKITLISTDLTSKTYIAIQENHASITNGTPLAVDHTPEGPNTKATTTLTIAGGALDLNAKITLISTDTTPKTYIGVTNGGAIANGKVLAAGDNPDGGGNMGGEDARIGMIAVQVGTSAATAANNIQTTMNLATGHNAGNANSKITIANNGAGALTLTQTVAGSAGNTDVTEAGDTSDRITASNFTGGNTYTAIQAEDTRIGMIAFMAGADAADAASMLQQTINHANGHNQGTANKKIIIANNGSGVLTLTQTDAGSSGNTVVTVQGDTSSRITVANNEFTGGKTSTPIRVTDANVGLAGTLDLFKLYGENQVLGEDNAIELSRALIKFDHSTLTTIMSKSLDISANSFKSFLYFRDVATGRTTPSNITLLALPLSKSFAEGIGRSVSTFNDLDCANFVTASFESGVISAWETEGANKTGSAPGLVDALTQVIARSPFAAAGNSTPVNQPTTIDLKSYFKLNEGFEDVIFDVTNAVSATLKSDISNHGFRISLDESEENDKKTYFIKRLGARHVRNTKYRPELHVLCDDSIQDNTLNLEFNVENTLYFTNFSKGAPANILSGTAGENPTSVVGDNCLRLVLSKSSYEKVINVSQAFRGTSSAGDAGLYSATFNINLFDETTLYNSSKGTTSLTVLNGPIDINTKITLISTDQTSITYIGITEDHVSITNGTILAVDDNPDGLGAIVEGDSRIGMRAFLVGSSSSDAATMLQNTINHANGHNAGNENSKLVISNNSKGVLILTQVTAGVSGNTSITITGDTSNRIKVLRNKYTFTGGENAITLEEVARVSGSIDIDASWKSIDKTVTYYNKKITVSTSSAGSHGHNEIKPVLSMTNLQDVYTDKDMIRLRVFCFDQNEIIHKSSKIPYSRKSKYVGDLYWQLIDETTGNKLIKFQFDTKATKLSLDSEGYYFDFFMSTPPRGSVCRFEFSRKYQGRTKKIDQKKFSRFKVM